MSPIRQDIRDEFARLLNGQNPIDIINSYQLIRDSAFKLIADSRGRSFKNDVESDAHFLFQMTALKMMAVLRQIEGYNYTNPIDNVIFNHITDPFSLCHYSALQN